MRILVKIRTLDIFLYLASSLCFFLAFICVFIKFRKSPPFDLESLSVVAMKSFFTQGKISTYNLNISKPHSFDSIYLKEFTKKTSNSEYSFYEVPNPPKLDESYSEYHSPDEKKYKIIESQICEGGLKYENFYVKNTSGIEIDIPKELYSRPDVHIKNSKLPQVLIYHTHTSESYLMKDEGFFYESYYPRSTDSSRNVIRVGEEIAKALSNHGINVLHDMSYHDNPTYKGSYSRSYQTIKQNLEKYPSIQVTIDVHRDSMGNPENGKVKPTFTINGHKAAQIMIVAGCDKDSGLDFPDWRQNLRLALKLHKTCETMFPGLTRPMSFGNFRYNMNLCHGAMLVEIGSDVNTLTEAVYSGNLLAEALAKVLNELRD